MDHNAASKQVHNETKSYAELWTEDGVSSRSRDSEGPSNRDHFQLMDTHSPRSSGFQDVDEDPIPSASSHNPPPGLELPAGHGAALDPPAATTVPPASVKTMA
ncbi:hypothetical protein BaRGS_00031834 [Batillaria attramentaria]|uniref:Uncharacterized protein n=1 Tax=Batillaria attramentaria TaxID=370345 RepID=A0ABD0JQF0_9CAEN